MSAAVARLLEDGERLMEEERRALLSGLFDRLGAIGADKARLLAELETAVPATPETPELRRALERLVEASRRNERVITAARAGLLRARRRISAIEAARRGDVAYARDGSRIVSRQDGQTRQVRA